MKPHKNWGQILAARRSFFFEIPPETPASVFSLDGIPAPGQLAPLGLQHVVAAIVGIITPAIMVANTCNLSDGDRPLLIQVSLIVTALGTLTVVVLQNFGKGVLKLDAILWGMIVGYVMALCLGMVDFSAVAPAGWFQLAAPLRFGVKFEASACISLAVVYVINAVQTIGNLSSTTMGGMDRMPTERELSGGIVAQGVVSILGALFGGLSAATYSQNVGIVTVNKAINKAVFAFASVILLAAGLVPKLSAILTTIPQAVIGGATISVFATITMTGIRMITSDHFSMRSSAVVGLSGALGVGITQVAGALQGPGFPTWVHTVFGSSPIVVTAIVAILLNLLLPRDQAAKPEA